MFSVVFPMILTLQNGVSYLLARTANNSKLILRLPIDYCTSSSAKIGSSTTILLSKKTSPTLSDENDR